MKSTCVQYLLYIAFGMDQEIPEYDMDSEDEQWLNRQVKHLKMDVSSLKFESMMDRLEKGSGQMVCMHLLHMFTMSCEGFYGWIIVVSLLIVYLYRCASFAQVSSVQIVFTVVFIEIQSLQLTSKQVMYPLQVSLAVL